MIFSESCKKYIDLQCNGDLHLYTDFPEIKGFEKYLDHITLPRRVADLGSGIGRATVFIENKYNWGADYCLVDGDSGDFQYEGIREDNNEFYNSHQVALDFCKENGVSKVHALHPENDSWWLSDYELIYSFLAFGFHWPITMIIDTVQKAIVKGGLVIFGLRGIEEQVWQDKQIKELDTTIWELIEYHLTPKLERNSTLVLRRKK